MEFVGMSIKLLLCLIVAGTLIHESAHADLYERAVLKLENVLLNLVESNSAYENFEAFKKYLSRNKYINRKNADIFLDPATNYVFYLFGNLTTTVYINSSRVEPLRRLDSILGWQACKPEISANSGRVLKVVHQVCRDWAQQTMNSWKQNFETTLLGRNRIGNYLRVFLEDDNSDVPNGPTMSGLVRQNLQGQKGGRLFAMAMYSQMDWEDGVNAMWDVNNTISDTYGRYIETECLNYKELDATELELAIGALNTSELISRDAHYALEQLSYRQICLAAVENKHEYMSMIIELISAKLV